MLTNDKILDLLAEYQDEDQYANVRLNAFARSLMDANKSMDEIALDIVRVYPTQKIQSIKELRTRTDSGLKEAKEAVERAMVVYFRAELAQAERRVANHNQWPGSW